MRRPRTKLFLSIITALTILVAAICFADAIPEQITINKIQKYYDPVVFNHGNHISALQDCSLCHHHTADGQVSNQNCVRCHKNSGAQPVVGCQGCHAADPFSSTAIKQMGRQQPPVYHRDQPGLKAAYHQQCLGCHQEMGMPTDCQDCHARNDSGDALFKSGKYAPVKTRP
ncbi:MAG: cytochrome c3 family protein [Trichlorobacter sp.]|nr:cytochrome c3 family protein [Trichlorobacter sp.]